MKGVRDCQNGDVEKGKFGGGEEVFTDADLCGGGELSCFRREGEFLEIDLQFFCLMKWSLRLEISDKVIFIEGGLW